MLCSSSEPIYHNDTKACLAPLLCGTFTAWHLYLGKDYRAVFSDFPVSFSVEDKRLRRSTGDG